MVLDQRFSALIQASYWTCVALPESSALSARSIKRETTRSSRSSLGLS